MRETLESCLWIVIGWGFLFLLATAGDRLGCSSIPIAGIAIEHHATENR